MLKFLKSALLMIFTLLLLAGCGLNGIVSDDTANTPKSNPNSPQASSQTPDYTSFEDVGGYIKAHNKLPDNFITKKEAKQLGWDSKKGNLHKVAPGKSIGGDVFQNREGKLPKKKGRVWYEADINYQSGHRGKDRILFSNDGLIFKTEDHYNSFEEIK